MFSNTFLSFIFAGSTILACSKNNAADTQPVFDSVPLINPVVPMIRETSGIADSYSNPGYLWAQEDSGNPPQLYLVGHDGIVLKKVYLNGAVNRDWEDMALSGQNLYVGDIGDNSGVYNEYIFYIFPEPALTVDTVKAFQTIRFSYPDGSHDAESFLVDPVSKDIFIITKSDNPSRIYKLAFPYSSMNTVSLVGTLPYSGIVSASISKSGNEILLKTYTAIRYYKRTQGEGIEQVLKKKYQDIPYQIEPQGEALSFANNNSGFFTLSEKGFFNNVRLFFYKRK